MFVSVSRSLRSPLISRASGRFSHPAVAVAKQSSRSFSSLPPNDPQAQFQPSPPKELNMEMAIGIQDANQLFLKYGVGQQRLKLLSEDENMPLVTKWQRMMQIYLGMQLHTVAGLGYQASEQGIMMYTQHLAQFVGACEPSVQDQFREVGRTTWRDMLSLAFALDDELASGKYDEELGVVDARNASHKVASKMIEPDVLEELSTKCGQLPSDSDPEVEMGMKHQVIQDVVVNKVYLGGSPSLVEELGYPAGPKGYALMQYVMAYHENDPLCMEYTSSSMVKLWQAAGLDLGNVPGAGKLPGALPSV
ncbi:unnamed protein product [Cylindrotheca closterium]|uniref:Uncharacterized protein n=1 Tax=Cylindrotheca closterium TaxID=2856 RepID=A0AAD2FIW7_9STRA|nr:unnamed protein product [Cylindrotheca closterium]